MLAHHEHLNHLNLIRNAAMAAADPEILINRILQAHRNTIRIGEETFRQGANGRLFLIAFGKASVTLACNLIVSFFAISVYFTVNTSQPFSTIAIVCSK